MPFSSWITSHHRLSTSYRNVTFIFIYLYIIIAGTITSGRLHPKDSSISEYGFTISKSNGMIGPIRTKQDHRKKKHSNIIQQELPVFTEKCHIIPPKDQVNKYTN
jgi:hypothetical protein